MRAIVDNTNPAYRHGHAGRGNFSPEYHSWACMIQRCTNRKNSQWKHYGGKGVKVCDRWRNFDNFFADMGSRPPGTSLDRIDVNGDYTPSNCRWADRTTQARNSIQVVWVELGGVRKRLVEWCEELNISINTVRDRVKYKGMDYATALTTPIQHKYASTKRKRYG